MASSDRISLGQLIAIRQEIVSPNMTITSIIPRPLFASVAIDPNKKIEMRHLTAAERIERADEINALKEAQKAHEKQSAEDAALLQADRAANPELYEGVSENHDLNAGNITTLDYKATLDQYNGIKGMIESGRINDVNFRGFNGTEQAESAGQYLFWLQAHMQEIGGGEAEIGKE